MRRTVMIILLGGALTACGSALAGVGVTDVAGVAAGAPTAIEAQRQDYEERLRVQSEYAADQLRAARELAQQVIEEAERVVADAEARAAAAATPVKPTTQVITRTVEREVPVHEGDLNRDQELSLLSDVEILKQQVRDLLDQARALEAAAGAGETVMRESMLERYGYGGLFGIVIGVIATLIARFTRRTKEVV
jgi:hypothetical protein